MALSFNNIAEKVIQDSIKSAIFIDDKVLLPFEKSAPDHLIDHSDLQSTFQEQGCSLSYYRYDKKDWEKQTDFLLGIEIY